MSPFSFCARFCAVAAFLVVSLVGTNSFAGDYDLGKELFTRDWSQQDEISPRGDGLGPVFNARSCVACHNQAGTGGGGLNKHNVDLLSIMNTSEVRSAPKSRRELVNRIHPGFATSTNVILHKFGPYGDYVEYRKNIMGENPISILRPWGKTTRLKLRVRKVREMGTDFIEVGPLVLRHTERNTPSLFGLGLIDGISDKVINETRNLQSKHGMTGTRSGKFGWRGQTATLEDFVLGACANELGLQTAGNKQPPVPTQPRYQLTGVDMSILQQAALIEYVASFPPPYLAKPSDDEESLQWRHGELAFGELKCNVCHAPQLGQVVGLYSDLMLHDMGDSLSDPVPAPLRSSGHYYGGLGGGPSLANRLWRTPPLWGVKDTGPYLHDGRAHTIDLAIRMHDGQAKQTSDEYKKLPSERRLALLAFVKSLGAPRPE
jgi:CxxC motif-containing protein (DUF1111 family)